MLNNNIKNKEYNKKQNKTKQYLFKIKKVKNKRKLKFKLIKRK